MVAMAKKVKTFQIVFTEPCKSFYCGGDAVSGRVQVEVNEVTRVSAMKLLALGCAKVEYAKGKQRCRQEAEYLRHQETLLLDGQPTGTAHFLSVSYWNMVCVIAATLSAITTTATSVTPDPPSLATMNLTACCQQRVPLSQ